MKFTKKISNFLQKLRQWKPKWHLAKDAGKAIKEKLLTDFSFLKSRGAKLWQRLFGKKEVEHLNEPLRLFTPAGPMIILISLVVVLSALLLILGWYNTMRITGKLVFAIGVTLVLLGMLVKIIPLLLKDNFTNISKVYGGVIEVGGKRIYKEYKHKLHTGEFVLVKRGWETTEGWFFTLQKLFRNLIRIIPVNKEQVTFEFKKMTWLAKDGQIDFDLSVTGEPANLHQILQIIGDKQDYPKLEKRIEVTLNSLAKTLLSDKTIDQARNESNKLSRGILDELSENELHWGFNFYAVLAADAGVSEEMTKALEQKRINQQNAEAIAASFKTLEKIPILRRIGKEDPKALAKIQMGLIGKGKYDTQNLDISGLSPEALAKGLKKLVKI